jgi:hypothetical protein
MSLVHSIDEFQPGSGGRGMGRLPIFKLEPGG